MRIFSNRKRSFAAGPFPTELDDASQKSIEDEHLPPPRELGELAGGLQTFFERRLERRRRRVDTPFQMEIPPYGTSARSTSCSSARVTTPRRSACCAA